MTRDRQLIDAIKTNLARKSSAQLREIVQSNDREHWSAEAFAAANEVLRDRAAGLAAEPTAAEEEHLPAMASEYYLDSLALMVGLNALTFPLGILLARILARKEDSIAKDQPVPFGPRIAWLALDTRDTAAAAAAVGLRETRAATWVDGIEAAHQSSVFVTPPLADWTLAVGTALFPDRAESFVKPLIERLSGQFGDAQYFCTHRDFELHIWARAQKGRLVRGYGWLGEKRLTLWDEGLLTREERELGFRFIDKRSVTVEPAGNMSAPHPDEDCVMQLANLWSIDPTALDEHFKEPVLGLLGSVEWGHGRTRE